MDTKIPTTVFTGFLGSGKTTLISNVLDDLLRAGEKPVYVKNEIGEADIDGAILKGKHIQTKELLNGCICCTLVGPFIQAIDELIEVAKPTRIVIESSGTADPSALALMVSSQPRLYRDGVIGVIDVVNFDGFSDLSLTAREQAKFTDLIIFNKVELVDLQRKQAVVGYVRELNEYAPIVEAPLGKVNPDVLFGISTETLDLLLQGHTHHENHLTEDHIEAIELRPAGYTTEEQIKDLYAHLPATVFRLKGFIKTEEGMKIANGVGKRLVITPMPQSVSETTNRLVCIGYHILDDKHQLESLFSSAFK